MEEVQIGLLRAYAERAVSAEELMMLRRNVETVLILMARTADVVTANHGFDDLVALYRPEDPDFGTSDSSPAQFIARDNLITAAGWISIADAMHKRVSSAELGGGDEEIDWRMVAAAASSLTTHTFGYLSAMLDARRDTARRGANGRRLIGATTRERVRKAAAQHRGKLSKDDAAEDISKVVNKSFGHVRRMLTKMFPGDSWSKSESDTSTDTTRQIDG